MSHGLPADPEVIDITALGQELGQEAAGSDSGLVVRTLVTSPSQRAVLMAFRAGAELPEHDAPRAATLHLLRGRAVLATVTGDRWELSAGQLVPIPYARHHVEAVEDSLALLTLTPHG